MRHARHLRTTHDYQFGKLQLAAAVASDSESESAVEEATDESVRFADNPNLSQVKCDIDEAQVKMAFSI